LQANPPTRSMRSVVCLSLLIALVTCDLHARSFATFKDANKTRAAETVKLYAQYLNAGNCQGWANLFVPNGVKYDEPTPIVGHDQLYKFCKGIASELPSFYYTLLEPPMVTNSGGLRLISKWLIGGADTSGKALGQTGIGSYVLNEKYQIVECTGYDYVVRA
jgi:hypothetical protein